MFVGDIRKEENLDVVFRYDKIDAVIHFAAAKSAEESVEEYVKDSDKYYDNNITGTIKLLNKMSEYKVNTLVFSSSYCVYRETETPKDGIDEDTPIQKAANPYGSTKRFA